MATQVNVSPMSSGGAGHSTVRSAPSAEASATTDCSASLAKLAGKRATWTAAIPAQDPLTASFEQKNLALSDSAVFALYTAGGSDSVRLTAFEIATGKRLWDRAIPTGTGFVAVGLSWSGDTVMLSTWQQLRAFSVVDGSDRFTIGSR